jgi:hypothetical protein
MADMPPGAACLVYRKRINTCMRQPSRTAGRLFLYAGIYQNLLGGAQNLLEKWLDLWYDHCIAVNGVRMNPV